MLKVIPILIFGLIASAAVAVFITVWRQSTKVEVYDMLACQFESFCRDGDCAATLPGDFGLIPHGKFDRAYLSMTDRPSQLSGTYHDDGAIDYFNGDNDRGNVTVTIRSDRSFAYSYQPTPGVDLITETGAGTCRSTTTDQWTRP